MALTQQWTATCDHCQVEVIAEADELPTADEALSALKQGGWVVTDHLFCDSTCKDQYDMVHEEN
jgi:hypothetical protein